MIGVPRGRRARHYVGVVDMEWTGALYAEAPPVEVELVVAAPPERVWPYVADVAFMPGTSSELQRIEWLDGATAPEVGARWVGHNRHPALGDWQAVSYVVECRAPEVLAWHVHDLESPAARWRFTLTPTADGGTLLRERVHIGPGVSGLTILIRRAPDREAELVHDRLCVLEANITRTLEAVKEAVEARVDPPPRTSHTA